MTMLIVAEVIVIQALWSCTNLEEVRLCTTRKCDSLTVISSLSFTLDRLLYYSAYGTH